jgi:hypothetical protein
VSNAGFHATQSLRDEDPASTKTEHLKACTYRGKTFVVLTTYTARMNSITIYLTGLAITAVISFLIVLYFKPHLKKILLELNGDKERPANFWVAYTTIILMLVPLIFAIWIVPVDNDVSVFFQISRQLKWALMGLVSSLIIIGIIIINFVPKSSEVKEQK